MNWLAYQSFVEEEKFDIATLNKSISIFIAIRKVEAATMEEAIGKFMLDTAALKFTKRIEPLTCFEFDNLKAI